MWLWPKFPRHFPNQGWRHTKSRKYPVYQGTRRYSLTMDVYVCLQLTINAYNCTPIAVTVAESRWIQMAQADSMGIMRLFVVFYREGPQSSTSLTKKFCCIFEPLRHSQENMGCLRPLNHAKHNNTYWQQACSLPTDLRPVSNCQTDKILVHRSASYLV